MARSLGNGSSPAPTWGLFHLMLNPARVSELGFFPSLLDISFAFEATNKTLHTVRA